MQTSASKSSTAKYNFLALPSCLACGFCQTQAQLPSIPFLYCSLQVWTTALKEDSTLLLPATLAKLSLEEAASTAQLCQLLLLQHAHHLDQATATSVHRLLLAVLLHYAAPVRRAGIQAVGNCLADKPQLAGMVYDTAEAFGFNMRLVPPSTLTEAMLAVMITSLSPALACCCMFQACCIHPQRFASHPGKTNFVHLSFMPKSVIATSMTKMLQILITLVSLVCCREPGGRTALLAEACLSTPGGSRPYSSR